MLSLLKSWKGKIEINGIEYDSVNDVDTALLRDDIHIVLKSAQTTVNEAATKRQQDASDEKDYKIKVRQYMTKKSNPAFDFMKKWNNDIPMPMRVMVGKKLQETKGMVKMELHGDLLQEVTPCCMMCGRPITNKVSQYFGMGPECGGHNYTNPFDSDEELKSAVDSYKIKLQSITWTGWIIKSAIEEEEVI